MTVYKNILKRRTVRIFQNKIISKKILKKMINAARLAPSARNLQPLEYLIVDDENKREEIFQNISFGGDVEKIQEKENRPKAYILILVNKKVREKGFEHDVGLAAGNIILTAQEEGVGCCIMGAINRKKISKNLKIPSYYFIDLLIALGYSKEEIKMKESEKISYYRNEKGVLFVVKRKIDKILHWNNFKDVSKR